MTIRRRTTKDGAPRWVVQWRLPDRSQRARTFSTEREAKVFEASVVTAHSRGEYLDPRRGRTQLRTVYESWIASRADLSVKVRRGYADCWRLRIEPAFGDWPIAKIDRDSIQRWVNAMLDDGLSPRTLRWYHSVLAMTLEHALDAGQLAGKNPATATRFPRLPRTSHVYLTAAEVDRLAALCGAQGDVVLMLAYLGLRFGELTGLQVEDVDLCARRVRVRRSITQVGGKLVTSLPKSKAGYRSVPVPMKLAPVLAARIAGRSRGAVAVTSPRGARLSRENWARSVRFREQTKVLGHPQMRIHDLRHTYASLARSAGADLKLLQQTMGHASITVTAHTYADLFDSDLDQVADALDTLSDHSHNQPRT